MLNQTATATAVTGAFSKSEQLEMKLIETVQDEKSEIFDRIDACRQLATIGGKKSIEPLAALLHGDERLAHMALYGLLTNPDSAVDDALRKAMDGAKGRDLMGIMLALGQRRDNNSVDIIAKHLSSSDKQVSGFAARALGQIGTQEAFESLRAAIRGGGITDQAGLYEGILRCANQFEKSDKQTALRIYERLQRGNAPDYVKFGAKEGVKRMQ